MCSRESTCKPTAISKNCAESEITFKLNVRSNLTRPFYQIWAKMCRKREEKCGTVFIVWTWRLSAVHRNSTIPNENEKKSKKKTGNIERKVVEIDKWNCVTCEPCCSKQSVAWHEPKAKTMPYAHLLCNNQCFR